MSINENHINKEVPKKRPRTENWLDQDKILLKELVRERVRAIENKNTDTNTNKKKKDAWTDLHNNFNSLCAGVPRTIVQLKAQWSFIKINAKKEYSQFRRETCKTGGGPCPDGPNIEADSISSWLPLEFTTDFNEFDGDKNQMPIRIEISDIPKAFVKPPQATIVETIEVVPAIKPPQATIVDNIEVMALSPEVVVPGPLNMVPAPVDMVPAPVDVVPVPLEVEKEDTLEQGLSNNVYAGNEILIHTTPQNSQKKKKHKIPKKIKKHFSTQVSEATTATTKIVEVENKCRQELHEIQMENERKKSRNLDLEYELLQAKLNYYKNKSLQ